MTNVAITPPTASRAADPRAATPGTGRIPATERAELVGARTTQKRSGEATVEERAGSQRGELAETVEHLNGLMQAIRRELHFQIDDRSGRTVITVVDAETQEIIRHIPPEEVADVAQYLDIGSGGLMTDIHA